MKEVVISFENVYKTYKRYKYGNPGLKELILNIGHFMKNIKGEEYTVLKNINLEIKRGESVGIIGHNGAGKSTMLGLIAGIIKPTKGNVKVDGDVLPLLELGAGFHPELTGWDNIFLYGVLLGKTVDEIRSKVSQIIEFSELGNFIYQPLRIYSAGMVMRLGFSIVTAFETDILLIDEVIAVGDIQFQKKCINKIKEYKKKGTTIVIISHSMDDILELCDRAILIENYEITKAGSAYEVVNYYLNKKNNNKYGT